MTDAAQGRGRFITFEGGEGAGKSTQVSRLAEALRARGRDVVVTREPGGAPGAEEIRTLLVSGASGRWSPMAEALLHSAARAEHLARTIRPALARGAVVISDRFADSTAAYQGVAQGLGLETVGALNALVVGRTVPDLTLILDLPAEAGLSRATRRAGASGSDVSRYEAMNIDFHETLRQAFLKIARENASRCAVIDASGAADSIAALILSVTLSRLAL